MRKENTYTCDICREILLSQGFAAHLRFKHKIKDWRAHAVELAPHNNNTATARQPNLSPLEHLGAALETIDSRIHQIEVLLAEREQMTRDLDQLLAQRELILKAQEQFKV